MGFIDLITPCFVFGVDYSNKKDQKEVETIITDLANEII